MARHSSARTIAALFALAAALTMTSSRGGEVLKGSGDTGGIIANCDTRSQ
jgi:hypothetical protein